MVDGQVLRFYGITQLALFKHSLNIKLNYYVLYTY